MATMSTNTMSQKLAVMQKLRESLSVLLEIRASEITPEATISDLGIDSLMSHEVAKELGKKFGTPLTGEDLIELDDMESLCQRLVEPSPSNSSRGSSRISSRDSSPISSRTSSCASSRSNSPTPIKRVTRVDTENFLHSLAIEPGVCEAAAQCMAEKRATFDSVIEDHGVAGYFENVYPLQHELVLAYVVEAFRDLGCDLVAIPADTEIPPVKYDTRHVKVVKQYLSLLEAAGLISRQRNSYHRTSLPVDLAPSNVLLAQIVALYPSYASEHRLTNVTGSKLALCLRGERNAMELLHNWPEASALFSDYFGNSPYMKAGASFLAQYLGDVITKSDLDRPVRILEVGAGSGGTSAFVLEVLHARGLNFEYTFSDRSPALVAAGQKKFTEYKSVKYKTIDIEKPTLPSLEGRFDIIFSSNSVHATMNAVKALRNTRGMLRKNGVLCLLEMMRNLPWYDIVFGLLERWWIFEDGRKNALVDQGYWDQFVSSAGFRWMDYSKGERKESSMIRLLVTSSAPRLKHYSISGTAVAKPLPWKETVTFKSVNDLSLEADLYYPREPQSSTSAPRPVALMIHGGAHVMLSRNDIRPQQTTCLIKAGFLPISIDYRLCPEVNILEGPMTDVRDAYAWIRNTLHTMPRERLDVKIDTSRVVVVGWSAGGHLAMTLGWTPAQCNLPPPEAILGFYCHTDYEDEFWAQPNVPRGSEDAAAEYSYLPLTHLREGTSDSPIVSYNVPPEHRSLGGWMSVENARSRIALWMNWTGNQREVLLQGLGSDDHYDDEADEFQELNPELVKAISPMAQIKAGTYTTPTFLIHGTDDDIVPWQHTKATFEALTSRGIEAECRIVQNADHVFDAVPGWQDDFERCKAVWDGYDFLKQHVNY